MEIKEFSNKMKDLLNCIDVLLDEQKIEKFYKYMNMLIDWNEKINLTAIIEPDEIILKHFVDSMTIYKYLDDGIKMADVGTGAGFPGIPNKIANPNIEVTLIDSLNKRIKFLQTVIDDIKLNKISVIHGRVEELGKTKEYRERFDVVTSRAVATLNVLLEYMLPFVKVGGICICMKGSEVEEEIKNSKKALEVLGGKIIEINKFRLPNSDMKRNLIVVKKVKSTPVRYPRRPGTPLKEPIG